MSIAIRFGCMIAGSAARCSSLTIPPTYAHQPAWQRPGRKGPERRRRGAKRTSPGRRQKPPNGAPHWPGRNAWSAANRSNPPACPRAFAQTAAVKSTIVGQDICHWHSRRIRFHQAKSRTPASHSVRSADAEQDGQAPRDFEQRDGINGADNRAKFGARHGLQAWDHHLRALLQPRRW
jgi:hypothetical protein